MNILTKRKIVAFNKRLLRVLCLLIYFILYALTIPRIIYYILGYDEEELYLQIDAIDMMIVWDVEHNIKP